MGVFKDNNSKIMNSVDSFSLYEDSTVVPNASLSPRQVFNLYARGESLPSIGNAVDEGSELVPQYQPRDRMEALQLSMDYQRQQSLSRESLSLPPKAENKALPESTPPLESAE